MTEHLAKHAQRTRSRRRFQIVVPATISAGLLILGSAIPLTAAAWQDSAWMNTSALGGENDFDIGVVTSPESTGSTLTGGTARQAEGTGIGVDLPDASRLAPGGAVSTQIGVFNNSSSLDALVSVRAERSSRAGLDISDHITVTVRDVGSGDVLIDGLFLDEIPDVGVELSLSARGGAVPALGDGDAFEAGEQGSSRILSITLGYSTTTSAGVDDTETLNGGKAHIRLVFEGAST